MEMFTKIILIISIILLAFGLSAFYLIPIIMGVTTLLGTFVYGAVGTGLIGLGIALSIKVYRTEDVVSVDQPVMA